MFISKFDLYKPEWLELIFDDRNKEYGAYDLRKHYAGNLLKAMGIAFFSISLLFIGFGLLLKNKQPVEIIKEVPVTLDPRIIAHPPRIEPVKPIIHQAPKPPVQIATTRDVPLIAVDDSKATNPPKTEILANTAIGPETIKGVETHGNPPIQTSGPGGIDPGPKANTNELIGTENLEAMPEPYGGAAAWAKFLQKNIHYPQQAQDAGAQGKVWLSFIIEKDGHLSNIKVERGVGYGLDEEALRVLRIAPAWKPGIQNHQPVRVKYTIPISFQLSDNN
ncbi:MAG: energy transducer TonB [Mucilaginibacter sp.]|nr:energy transducer TonB [Mucilaginibacter sp.]